MNKELTPFEKLLMENAMLRLEMHSFVMSAKKVVDSSRSVGKSGLQKIVLSNYIFELQEGIKKFESDRRAENAARNRKS